MLQWLRLTKLKYYCRMEEWKITIVRQERKMLDVVGCILVLLFAGYKVHRSLSSFLIAKVNKLKYTKLTDFFVLDKKKSVIYQKLSEKGKDECRKLRVTTKNLNSYPFSFGKLLVRQLKLCVSSLECGKNYTTTTHLLSVFENTKIITILHCKKQRKRMLIIESIELMGFRYFLHALFNRKYYNKIIKQFYKIEFEKEEQCEYEY